MAAALKEANVSSADAYLGQAKLLHVRNSHPWTDDLQLTRTEARRSILRGVGTPNRAPELRIADVDWDLDNSDRPGASSAEEWDDWGDLDCEDALAHPGRAYLTAHHFLMREIEIAAAELSDITFGCISHSPTGECADWAEFKWTADKRHTEE